MTSTTSGNATLRAPTHLTKAGKAIWKETVSAQAPGYFTAADIFTLEAYVGAVIALRTASETLAHEGFFSVGSQGQTIQHPAIRIQDQAARLINQCAQRLAIDPTSRKAAQTAPLDDTGGELGGLLT